MCVCVCACVRACVHVCDQVCQQIYKADTLVMYMMCSIHQTMYHYQKQLISFPLLWIVSETCQISTSAVNVGTSC